MDKLDLISNQIQEIYLDENKSREYYNEEIICPEELDKFINEAVEFVNEAYVGKTPILEKIEEQIGVIRGMVNRYDDFDSHKEVQKLNRLFEQQFNMEVFALHMDPHKEINGYTCVLANNFDIAGKINYAKFVTADRKDGFKFKPGNGACIYAVIYWGLWGNPDFTDGELLAIILHEIGHNFADFIDNKIQLANKKMMESFKAMTLTECILGCMTIILAPFYIHRYRQDKKILKHYTNEYKKKKEIENQDDYDPSHAKRVAKKASREDFWKDLRHTASRYNPINRILARAYTSSRTLYKDELSKAARESVSRRNEIIADKFAGVYGYGPELASSFQKMGNIQTRVQKWTAKLPGGEKVNRLYEDLYKDINEFDCHPHHIQRINECIKLLKDELNQDEMDPKMKKVIIDQISQLEAIVKDIATKVKKDPDNISAAYAAFVNEELPDATTQQIEDEITNEYNKIMSKKKK